MILNPHTLEYESGDGFDRWCERQRERVKLRLEAIDRHFRPEGFDEKQDDEVVEVRR